MSPRARTQAVGILAAVGGALLGIVQVSDEIERFATIPERVYTWATIVGLILLALAGLVFLTRWVAIPHSDYVSVKARKKDLVAVREFAIRHVDADVFSPVTLQSMYARNPDMIYLVVRHSHWGMWRNRTIAGLFSVLPVNAKARSCLVANEPRGFRIEDHHVTPKGRRPAALYIAILGANGSLRASGFSLLALSTHLSGLVDRTPQVFTRPVTSDGLRLVKKYGFKPVAQGTREGETVFHRNFEEDPL